MITEATQMKATGEPINIVAVIKAQHKKKRKESENQERKVQERDVLTQNNRHYNTQ